MKDRLLDVSTVANMLCCSVQTIYRHKNDGKGPLRFVSIGPKKGIRVLESSVKTLLEQEQFKQI